MNTGTVVQGEKRGKMELRSGNKKKRDDQLRKEKYIDRSFEMLKMKNCPEYQKKSSFNVSFQRLMEVDQRHNLKNE